MFTMIQMITVTLFSTARFIKTNKSKKTNFLNKIYATIHIITKQKTVKKIYKNEFKMSFVNVWYYQAVYR